MVDAAGRSLQRRGRAKGWLVMAGVLYFLHVSVAPAPEAQGSSGAACGSVGASVVELIEKKRDGGELSSQEIGAVVSGFHKVLVVLRPDCGASRPETHALR